MAQQPKPPPQPAKNPSLPDQPPPVPSSPLFGGSFANAGNIAWITSSPSIPDPQLAAKNDAAAGDAWVNQGRFADALPCYLRAAQADPQNAAYHYKLAVCAWEVRQLELVEQHLLQAAQLAPAHPAVHGTLAQWFFETAHIDQALFHSARAVELAPRDPGHIATRAMVLENSGNPDAAWALVHPLVSQGLRDRRLSIIYARLAARFGQEAAAIHLLQQHLASSPLPAAERGAMHFAAANLLDKQQQYDQAFEHARQAHQTLRQPWDPAQYRSQIDQLLSYFTPERLARLPQVFGGGELPLISRIAHEIAPAAPWSHGRPFPHYLDLASPQALDNLATAYLSAIRAINASATYITDKMPQNYHFLGLISLLFPQCHIIHCRRDPLDTCLSCYMSHFARGHDYAHDLSHLAAFYADYLRQMDHWKRTLSLPILDVSYEDMVRDQEAQTRRLLQFLNLPWDQRCLAFHASKRSVATVSSAQVRQPLYASSVGRWKHYEKHLAPLNQAQGRPL